MHDFNYYMRDGKGSIITLVTKPKLSFILKLYDRGSIHLIRSKNHFDYYLYGHECSIITLVTRLNFNCIIFLKHNRSQYDFFLSTKLSR